MPFDPKRWNRLDQVIVGAGVVVLIAMFLPWYGVDYHGPLNINYSTTWSAWSTFMFWFGSLLLVVAAAYVALRRSEVSMPELPVGPNVAVAGVAALGLLLILIRWLSLPKFRGVDAGTRFGFWLALIAGIVEVVAAVLSFRGSGEALPWDQKGAPPAA